MRTSRNNWIWALALVAIVVAASTAALAGKSYGEGVSGADTIKISELIAASDDYVGKTVRVEGLITGVCEKRGCWMSLASDEEFQEVRIKAEDGVIVFPIEAKGKHAVAEGVFAKMELTMEQTLARAKHHSEQHGTPYEPEKITEPAVWYQINVTGAVID